MKRLLFVLICTVAFFSVNLETQAHAEQSEDFETEAYVPISKMWYETLPIPYQGRLIYHREQRHNQCLHCYLGARNTGASHYIYEGYLYPCDGYLPIPTSKPVEEESE